MKSKSYTKDLKEEVYTIKYYDFHSAKLAIIKFIEGWYNRERIHGSIGYITTQMKKDLCTNILQ